MTDSAQPPDFALQGPISIDSTVPANTSGAFCDLFTGVHPIAGKVALKRPRGNYNEALMKVSLFIYPTDPDFGRCFIQRLAN